MNEVKENKFNLGSKNVWKTFLTILIPTLVAQLIAGTFVVFDTFFVSHGFHPGKIFEGINETQNNLSYASLGTAAISYAQPYTFFIIGIGLAIGAGLASIMTKQLAKNDRSGMQKTMNSFGAITIYLGFFVGIFIFLFAKPLVWLGSGFQKDYLNSWFNNPGMNKNWNLDGATPSQMYGMVNGHILSQSAWYLRIQALGLIPYMYMIAGVIMLRVEGKAHLATIFSVSGLLTNIIFDYIFIMLLKMNVIGAAIATVMGYFITAVIYRWFFTKKADLKETKFDWNNAKKIMKLTLSQGTSIMMLQLLSGIILLIFTFSIGITNYGNMYDVTNYTAVYQGYNALFIFVNLVIIGVVQSMKPIIDFNYQKGNYELVKKGRNIGLLVGMTFSIVVTIFIILFPQIINAFYTVDGTTVDYITTGYFGIHPLPINGSVINDNQLIYTNGMHVASSIVGILFISFPFSTLILTIGAYLQGIERQNHSIFLTFGKAIFIFPMILIFGFIPQLSSLFTSQWTFKILENGLLINSFDEQANLGMFLSLPIIDIIFGVTSIVFIMIANKNMFFDHKKQKHIKLS